MSNEELLELQYNTRDLNTRDYQQRVHSDTYRRDFHDKKIRDTSYRKFLKDNLDEVVLPYLEEEYGHDYEITTAENILYEIRLFIRKISKYDLVDLHNVTNRFDDMILKINVEIKIGSADSETGCLPKDVRNFSFPTKQKSRGERKTKKFTLVS